MNPILKWTVIALAALLVGVYILFCFMAGGPKDAFYMVRYALPHMHRGHLKVGDNAPDARLVALDAAPISWDTERERSGHDRARA